MYLGRVEETLLEASQVFFSIVYHFDSITYHPFPNRGELLTRGRDEPCRSTYGLDAMRHLLVLQKL